MPIIDGFPYPDPPDDGSTLTLGQLAVVVVIIIAVAGIAWAFAS